MINDNDITIDWNKDQFFISKRYTLITTHTAGDICCKVSKTSDSIKWTISIWKVKRCALPGCPFILWLLRKTSLTNIAYLPVNVVVHGTFRYSEDPTVMAVHVWRLNTRLVSRKSNAVLLTPIIGPRSSVGILYIYFKHPHYWVSSLPRISLALTHWGRVTYICVGKLTSIGSDNAGILLIRPLGTNLNDIVIGIQTFSFKKLHLKRSSVCMVSILSRLQWVNTMPAHISHIDKSSAGMAWTIWDFCLFRDGFQVLVSCLCCKIKYNMDTQR